MEKRRLQISSQQKTTLPADFCDALGSETERDCIFADGMLVLTPVATAETPFTQEVLADLVQQSYSGEQLLMAFQELRRQIRPAVETMIKEVDQLARVAASEHVDSTDDIFEPSKNR